MPSFKSILSHYRQHKKSCYLLALILLAGIFLRFYKLEEFITFLGDQARDAIVLKRILTLEHLPAIGAASSVGTLYLGPFYYYFIAPWLWFSNFNPLGPAIGVAFFSCLYLLINYCLISKIFDKQVGLISTVLITFSLVLITYSRFSWNPNLLPLVTLLIVYLTYQIKQNDNLYSYLFLGALLAIAAQLHYLALLLIPPSLFFVIFRHKRTKIVNYFSGILSFFLISFPLIFFELRHQFLNTRGLIALLFNSDKLAPNTNKLISFSDAFHNLNSFFFNFNPPSLITSILFFGLLFLMIKTWHNKSPISYFYSFFLFILFGLSLYNGNKNSHYLIVLYPLYAVIIAYLLNYYLRNNLVLTGLIVVLFVIVNARGYAFITDTGSKQIQLATRVATLIKKNHQQTMYALTSVPEQSSDDPYRYFLEIWGDRPIARNSLEKVREMFIVCEHDCVTIGNPQWDIAYFAAKKQTGFWQVDNVKIFRLAN